jgi:hypothetical protein
MEFEQLKFFYVVFGFSVAPAAIVVLRFVFYSIKLWNLRSSKDQPVQCSVQPVLECHH